MPQPGPRRARHDAADIIIKEAGKVRLVRLERPEDVNDLLALLEHVRLGTNKVA